MSGQTGSPDAADAASSTTNTVILANGQQVTTCHPEQIFDLANLALSKPPADDRLRVVFDALHAQLPNQFKYVPAEVQLNPNNVHGLRQTVAGGDAPVNWSGAEVDHPERKFLTGVVARWVIPDIKARTQNTKEFMSSWIGIDGDEMACRAGIGCDVLRTGNTDTKTFYPWFEWFPAAEVKITTLPVDPGDSVFVTLCVDPETQATATFINETTGDATSVVFTAPSDDQTLHGEKAEWIVAAPTVDGQQGTLASYGEVFFSDCVAFTPPVFDMGEKVRPRSALTIDMQDGTGILSEGTVVTETIVRCRYVGHRSPAKSR
jgi:hypothetical protein